MQKSTQSLAAACIAAARSGADFPTIWHSILKSHPSVAGMPVQRLDGGSTLLEIPLLLGHKLVVGPSATDYAIAFD